MSAEEARAVAEVAKASGEFVKAGERMGGYLAGIFASVPHDLVGLMGGDWLSHARRRNLATLEAATRKHVEAIEQGRIDGPSPSILLPLVQAAADEGRPELQAMWSALLANAMVDGGKRIRRTYFDVVRQMEPVDAIVFKIIAECPDIDQQPSYEEYIRRSCEDRSVEENEYRISLIQIQALGCIQLPSLISRPAMTAFGRGLWAALTVT